MPGGVEHSKKHPLDSQKDHSPPYDWDTDGIMVYDENGMPKCNWVYDRRLERQIPGAGYDYVELGYYPGPRNNLMITISNTSDGHEDIYMLMTFPNMTNGEWWMAQPVAGTHSRYLLLVRATSTEVYFRLMRAEASIALPGITHVHIFDFSGGYFNPTENTGTQSPLPSIWLPQGANVQQFLLDLDAAGKYNGDIVAGTSGETMGFGDVCYLKQTDKRWYLADKSALATCDGQLGLCCSQTSIGAGIGTTFLLKGYARSSSWSFVVNDTLKNLYIGDDGTPTQTKPSSPDITRHIGFPITANVVWFEADEIPETITADEKVKADSTDPTAGYLEDKVDDSTIEVDTTGHALRLKSVYRCLALMPSVMSPEAGTFDGQTYTLCSTGVYEDKWYLLAFENGDRDAAKVNFSTPLDYKAGTDLGFVIQWVPNSATAGNVKWKIGTLRVGPNGSLSGTPTYLTVVTATPEVAVQKTQSEVTIDGTNYQPGDTIALVILRDSGDAEDTYAGDCWIVCGSIHYESNKRGEAI